MTNLNPPRAVRAVLYLIGTLGVIALQWATAKGYLDGADQTALAAVIALILALATANTIVTPPDDAHHEEL